MENINNFLFFQVNNHHWKFDYLRTRLEFHILLTRCFEIKDQQVLQALRDCDVWYLSDRIDVLPLEDIFLLLH